jgi:hypothetical protein
VTKLVGLLAPAGSVAYFFRGTRYARYDVAARAVEPGCPNEIRAHWPGLFDRDIDAALPWPDGSVYFFRGAEYIKYDLEAGRVFGGLPRPIAANWPGVFEHSIDAAVLWPGGERAYFFRGAAYVRYDVAADRAAHGPRPIAGNWPGLFERDIETALAWPDCLVSFFRAGECVTYDAAVRLSTGDRTGSARFGDPDVDQVAVEGALAGHVAERVGGGPVDAASVRVE